MAASTVDSDCVEACNNVTAAIGCLSRCFEAAGWSSESGAASDVFGPVGDLVLSTFLIIMSAVFSGLTLGLMSLDKMGLQIIMEGGEPQERKYAAKIAPIREKGNLLLCTLLLGNVTVNTLLAITMAHITNGWMGFLLSTALIVLVGEIFPQAVCSRHGLAIGAHTVWLVKIVIFCFYPIAWPISLVLDRLLGREIGIVYSQEELEKLIEIHVTCPEAQQESGLTQADHTLLIGVMEYKKKKAKEVMTSLDKVFMLEHRRKLDFQTLFEIYKSGYTRVPVYEGARENIVGVLYVKDLILVDPQDAVEIRTIVSFHGDEVCRASEETMLDDVFKKFRQSYIHMLFATKSEQAEANGRGSSKWLETITGIITLEDVIEEMIRDGINDEPDLIRDSGKELKRFKKRPDIAGYLNLYEYDHRGADDEGRTLTPPEIQAVTAFLSMSADEFKKMPAETVLKGLVRRATVIQRQDTLVVEAGADPPETHTVYRRGKAASHFTLILQGKLLIRAGKEEFESELGPWTSLGETALVSDEYRPDFSAVIAGPCRLLQIQRRDYLAALRLAQLDHVAIGRSLRQQAVNLHPTGATEEGKADPMTPASDAPKAPLVPVLPRPPCTKPGVDLISFESPRAATAAALAGHAGHVLGEGKVKARLTSLGSENWARLELEADGQGFIFRFDNKRYKEETTISIYSQDSRLLLANLTESIQSAGLIVRSAKIYTEGDKVLDVFGVVKENGQQVPEEEWPRLRESITMRVLSPDHVDLPVLR